MVKGGPTIVDDCPHPITYCNAGFIGISCQAPTSIWALLVLMLVIITIVISPLVIKFFKYRWWDVHRTLETQEEG